MEEESEDGVSEQVVKFDMTDWQFELKKMPKFIFLKFFSIQLQICSTN